MSPRLLHRPQILLDYKYKCNRSICGMQMTSFLPAAAMAAPYPSPVANPSYPSVALFQHLSQPCTPSLATQRSH